MHTMTTQTTDLPDTKERILDAAERLFADWGFAATSLRNITGEAGVNLAAVNYHFGSKDALIVAVFERRLEPLNRERLDLLDAAEKRAGDEGPPIEEIVEAFIGPPLRASRDPQRGGLTFMRLLGHAMNQPKAQIRRQLAGQFREIAERFRVAVGRAFPELPDDEVLWRLLFMVGTMAHTMAMADELCELSEGLCDPTDVDALIARMVPFIVGGLQSAPASGLAGGGP
jgi:AcrR family transcriptional regulator